MNVPGVLAGRFTRAKLDAALTAVCARVGLDHRDAELIKFTNNAVFRLARDPAVVRIAGSPALLPRVDKVVRVAGWLTHHDVPAVRLLPGITQPVLADGHVATVWRYVPPVGPPPTTADLARLLRRFHDLPTPPFPLPRWRPIDDVRRRIADAEALRPDDRTFLERRCDEVEATLATLRYALPGGPIHGDAFLGNLVPSPDGPVLCDFDSTSTGPREWDLVPVAVGRLRFGHPPELHEALAAGYGFDVITWPGFPALRQVRELKLATSVLPILRSNPGVVDQVARRLHTLRTGDTRTTWTPYG